MQAKLFSILLFFFCYVCQGQTITSTESRQYSGTYGGVNYTYTLQYKTWSNGLKQVTYASNSQGSQLGVYFQPGGTTLYPGQTQNLTAGVTYTHVSGNGPVSTITNDDFSPPAVQSKLYKWNGVLKNPNAYMQRFRVTVSFTEGNYPPYSQTHNIDARSQRPIEFTSDKPFTVLVEKEMWVDSELPSWVAQQPSTDYPLGATEVTPTPSPLPVTPGNSTPTQSLGSSTSYNSTPQNQTPLIPQDNVDFSQINIALNTVNGAINTAKTQAHTDADRQEQSMDQLQTSIEQGLSAVQSREAAIKDSVDSLNAKQNATNNKLDTTNEKLDQLIEKVEAPTIETPANQGPDTSDAPTVAGSALPSWYNMLQLPQLSVGKTAPHFVIPLGVLGLSGLSDWDLDFSAPTLAEISLSIRTVLLVIVACCFFYHQLKVVGSLFNR